MGQTLLQECPLQRIPALTFWRSGCLACGDARQYLRARMAQAELMIDEILELADDTSHDVLYDADGFPVKASNVRIQRNKLQIDSRMFFLTKVLPRFGDRIVPTSPLIIDAEVEELDDREIARQTALILYRADPKRLTVQRKE